MDNKRIQKSELEEFNKANPSHMTIATPSNFTTNSYRVDVELYTFDNPGQECSKKTLIARCHYLTEYGQ